MLGTLRNLDPNPTQPPHGFRFPEMSMTGFRGGSKSSKGKFSARQLSLRSFQQTVKNHANTINKASNVK